MSEANPENARLDSPASASSECLHESEKLRSALSLSELLEVLVHKGCLEQSESAAIEARTMTLRSQVLKARVGAVRSQAAARYDVSPAEIVSIANAPYRGHERRNVDEDVIAQMLASAAKFEYMKLDPLRLDNALIANTFSRAFERHHVIVPISRCRDDLTLALTDPFDTVLRQSLEDDMPNTNLSYVVSSKKDIVAIIDRVHGFQSRVNKAHQELGGASSQAIVALVELRTSAQLSATSDEHVVSAVEYLLRFAFDQRASDIHLEPKEEIASVRFRIDGILHEVETLPTSVLAAITSRIKVLARMDIAERRRPQDGRIKTQRGDREVELRVSSMPTAYGEKIVIRVFDPNVLMAELPELGFSSAEREHFEGWITSPSGLILVTGPTGSGKTTTLYSTLRYLSGPEINITTVEDPIELVDPRFSQVQVQSKLDVTFAHALRTILRQDPDIIMVGEIRDRETAAMAVQAALTGHLVFSTLHTRDAAGAITRLTELGVEPFLLASVLRGVLAQRLVRRICPHCGLEGRLTPQQVDALGIKVPAERREQLLVRFGEGCPACRHTGLLGRIGIFEMLPVGRRVQTLIKASADANEINDAARIEGMESLQEASIRRLAEGTTPFEEVIRVVADRIT